MLDDNLKEQLNSLYSHQGNERVGFIIGQEVVEVENQHPDAARFFDVSLEDIEKYVEKAWAIWHTQPSKLSQLSYEDYTGFFNFPDHKHIVIGTDGIRVYRVQNGAVVKDSLYLR